MMMPLGYTLIEVLIILSILSILGICSTSLTRDFIDQNYQMIQVNNLLSALQYTRMVAVRYGKTAAFCGSSDFKTCDGQWEKGQIIKVNEQVIRIFSGMKFSDQLLFKSNFGKNQSLAFSPLGFTQGQQGSFYYVSGKGKEGYRIIVFYTGTIRVERVLNSHKVLD